MTVRPLKKGWEKRQCQFEVARPPAHRCAKIAKRGSDFCQHHEKAGYAARAVHNIDWGGEKAMREGKKQPLPTLKDKLIQAFGLTPIAPVKCQCGAPVCKKYGLSIGLFYQGSGFYEDEAKLICEALNKGRGLNAQSR